jgi:hypothetical protein
MPFTAFVQGSAAAVAADEDDTARNHDGGGRGDTDADGQPVGTDAAVKTASAEDADAAAESDKPRRRAAVVAKRRGGREPGKDVRAEQEAVTAAAGEQQPRCTACLIM